MLTGENGSLWAESWPAAAAKSAYELRTKLSSAIFRPGPQAGEAERAAFRRALGVPDKAENYPFRPRDGVPSALYTSDLAQARLGKVATILHNHDVRGEATTADGGVMVEIELPAQRQEMARIITREGLLFGPNLRLTLRLTDESHVL